MPSCKFNADQIFKRFRVIDFPKPFVGLEVSQNLCVGVDLNKSAYIQTMYQDSLMSHDEAREVSANHRAFMIEQIGDDLLKITFKPTNECIYKGKLQKLLPNRFVISINIIQIDGTVCCHNKAHQEIGRFYISGEYENVKIYHKPNEINFGDVVMNTKSIQNVRLFNESDRLNVKMNYVRVAGYEVIPEKFTLRPLSSKSIKIVAKPVSLTTTTDVVFQMRNVVSSVSSEDHKSNFLRYCVKVTINVQLACNKNARITVIESLHKLIEPDPRYAYMECDQEIIIKKKNIALKQLELSKQYVRKSNIAQRVLKGKDNCQIDTIPFIPDNDFCTIPVPKLCTTEVLDFFITPYFVNLGRVGVSTCGEKMLTVTNNTKCDIKVSFIEDTNVKYTEDRLTKYKVKVKSFDNLKFMIYVYTSIEKELKGTFSYIINKKFYRSHPYCIHGEQPALELKDNILRFGMVSSDVFTTSLSLQITNDFNESINFRWNDLEDKPFKIEPSYGTIPKKSILLCNVSFQFRKSLSKIRSFDCNFISLGNMPKIIPLEFNIVARKLGIKFLQMGACFKEIPMNLEATEKVQLENASKEIATFYVVEPLIAGMTIEPMKGIIRPKTIMIFKVTLKIACVVEFNIEVIIRINGKENIILPVSAHIIEPNVVIHPKNIYMARVPGDLITYVPVIFHNQGSLKSTVEFINTGNIDDFDVYIADKNEKQRVHGFTLEGNHYKTIFVRVYDDFRRQFDLYLPFKINGMLGPPSQNNSTTDLEYYIRPFEIQYELNPKIKIKPIRKEICYVHIWGVITIPWIKFSLDNFDISYISNEKNEKEFTMTNVSRYDLNILIVISKLSPNFTLKMSEKNETVEWISNESQIKFHLSAGNSANLIFSFHPKGYGKFVAVALLHLVKHTSIPYHNLTFVGKRGEPPMEPNLFRLIFPPCRIEEKIFRIFTVKIGIESQLDAFSCIYADPHLLVDIQECKNVIENDEYYCLATVKVWVFSENICCRYTMVQVLHECGSRCEVEVYYCYSQCPLTLLASNHMNPDENPYPYYPETDSKHYVVMETYMNFLQKWMYAQGFRRELFPIIPDTIHATSTNVVVQAGKSKGVNGNYLNFIRRVAGPLLKITKKAQSAFHELSYEQVKDVHDTYKDILTLLRSRGANAWVIEAIFLLSFEQFSVYAKKYLPNCKAERLEIEKLLADENLYNRLNKQNWFDFIVQSYKVFVIDTCFFECVCITEEPRDVVKVLINWYNNHLLSDYEENNIDHPIKKIEDIAKDLSDGCALKTVLLHFCPFLDDHFSSFIKVNKENHESAIIHNACLIIGAINVLKLYFPLNIHGFLKPNFLEMFFLSVHLYVTLPMFSVKERIHFNPPHLRSSLRQMVITPSNQESLTFNYHILNNVHNSFLVEKQEEEVEKDVVINVKFICNFLSKETALLLVHGYNKTRIFDTYITFILEGEVGSINHMKKCKVTAPLYRSNKVEVLMSSPFETPAVFTVYVTDEEPTLPVTFKEDMKPRFYLRRLNPIEKEVLLSGRGAGPKEAGPLDQDQKVYFYLICLSNEVFTSWVWFRSEVGEFYIRIMTYPRLDSPIDHLYAKMITLPIEPCSCGEECECYRTTAVTIPHCNDIMLRALKQSLAIYASELMLKIFDELTETVTGRIVLANLLEEGGTIMSEVEHILKDEIYYKLTSRTLKLHVPEVTLAQYSRQMFILPVTMLPNKKTDKFSVTMTSRCGLSVRTYKIVLTTSTSSSRSPLEEEICGCTVCAVCALNIPQS